MEERRKKKFVWANERKIGKGGGGLGGRAQMRVGGGGGVRGLEGRGGGGDA